jgi:WD40 repeat protein
MAAEADLLLGAHNEAVKCLSYAPELRVAVSGSWDKTVKLWDCRHTECSSSHELPDKVYTMAISGFRLVTGTAGVCACSCSARALPPVGVSRLVLQAGTYGYTTCARWTARCKGANRH